MQGLRTAQNRYDRYLPEDNRTDAEIELDAAERARERRQAAAREALLARVAARNQPKAEASSDGEQKTART